MKQGTLTRIQDPEAEGRNPLRTKSVRGEFKRYPAVGESFEITNDEPLDDPLAFKRGVWTSEVKEILENGTDEIRFRTWSGSVYKLEVHR